MSTQPDPELAPVEVRSFFVRNRNCLLVRGKFSPMFIDFYLHLMEHGLQLEGDTDSMLKDALACLALHLCSRPLDEGGAWTLNFHHPLMNLFVAGSNRPGQVTGRIFTEDVRDAGKNLFIAQLTRTHQATRQSMIDFAGNDIPAAVEQFYTQSEQRRTRVFRLPDEEYVQVSAEPDADDFWLENLALEQVQRIEEDETLSLLESRSYIFHCGCSLERLYPLLARLNDDDLDYLFEPGHATLSCPRCGARYRADRDGFQRWRAAS
jgi:molecular chaperone Hsp33